MGEEAARNASRNEAKAWRFRKPLGLSGYELGDLVSVGKDGEAAREGKPCQLKIRTLDDLACVLEACEQERLKVPDFNTQLIIAWMKATRFLVKRGNFANAKQG